MTTLPSFQQLQQAVKLAEKIDRLQKELASIVGEQAPASGQAPARKRRGRPPMSREAREKIAAAQRKRWAKSKGPGA